MHLPGAERIPGISMKGQAALTLTFLIGWIAIFVGVTLAFFATSFGTATLGFQAASRSLAAASSGADDALLHLVRDKDYLPFTNPYTLDVDSITATITITHDSPVTGQVTIISDAGSLGAQRTIQVIASVDAATGEVKVLSWALQ